MIKTEDKMTGEETFSS